MSWVGLFALGGSILIWTLPESPRWFMQEQERNQAAEALRTLRHTNMIDAELDEIERQEATVSDRDVSIVMMFTSGRFRWPTLTSITLSAVQQFCGINTVRTKRITNIVTLFILDIFLFESDVFNDRFYGGQSILGYCLYWNDQSHCNTGSIEIS